MNMKISFISYVYLWILISNSFNNSVLKYVDGGCSLPPSISVSESSITNDGILMEESITSFNDVDQLGGIEQIDKIIRIDIYGVNALFRNVISKIETTYIRTDGQIQITTHGMGGTLLGQMDIYDGQYINKIQIYKDKWVQHIQICRTDNICFGPYGYNIDTEANYVLYNDRSVIKAFLGKSGTVIDELRVYYETDKLYMAEIGEIIYQNTTSPSIITDLSFITPKAKVTVDNLGSSIAQSTSVSFVESVSTYETTIVTKTKQLYGSFTLTTAPGMLVELGVADLSASFTVGTSFSTILSESNTKEIQTSISREYTVVAPPYSVVTGQVYWRQIKYAYNWYAPIQCLYTFDPTTIVRGGTIEGTMFGTQAFPHSYVKFTQQFSNASGTTSAPNQVNISMPPTTFAPIGTSKEPSTVRPSKMPSGKPVRVPIKYPTTNAPVTSTVGSSDVPITSTPVWTSPVSPPMNVNVPEDLFVPTSPSTTKSPNTVAPIKVVTPKTPPSKSPITSSTPVKTDTSYPTSLPIALYTKAPFVRNNIKNITFDDTEKENEEKITSGIYRNYVTKNSIWFVLVAGMVPFWIMM